MLIIGTADYQGKAHIRLFFLLLGNGTRKGITGLKKTPNPKKIRICGFMLWTEVTSFMHVNLWYMDLLIHLEYTEKKGIIWYLDYTMDGRYPR